MKATPEEQQLLLALADTDEEIRRLEHRRSNLPEQQALDEHLETQEQVMGELVEASQTQDRLKAESSRHEREIETAEAGRKHSEAQIYSGKLTSERELGARKEEIGEFKRRKADLEDALLELMEQLEEITVTVDELSKRRQELEEQVADLSTRRDSASTGIDAELEQLRVRREKETTTVSDAILATYEKLAGTRKSRAVARLEGKICSGCHIELTAIELEEVTAAAKNSLAYCEQCGSILVPAT